MKGVLPWLVLWVCRAGTRDFCSALAVLVAAQYKIRFSSPYTISIHLSPSPSKLGRQACWVVCLLIWISLVPTVYVMYWGGGEWFALPQFTVYCGRGEGFTVPTALKYLFAEDKVYNTNTLQCIGKEERVASMQCFFGLAVWTCKHCFELPWLLGFLNRLNNFNTQF